MMVGSNLKDTQLQQIVDKTIIYADKDNDGKISFEEFCNVSESTMAFDPLSRFFLAQFTSLSGILSTLSVLYVIY